MPNRKLPLVPAEILLVEDNPGDIRLMEEAFREGGLSSKLFITRDGEQAMDYLHQTGAYTDRRRPSLILLDLNLPRKSGREVLAEIKQEKRLRSIPVMILSTSISPDDICRAYDLHANCYLQKPGDLEGLVQLGKLIEAFWLNSAMMTALACR